MKVKVIVRTWKSARDESARGYSNKMLLESVFLPLDAVKCIEDWAREFQIGLLDRKYRTQPLNFMEAQTQSWAIASNRLLDQFQQEGLDSDLELLAITFLIGQHRDNPESIDLAVTADYLSELEKPEAV